MLLSLIHMLLQKLFSQTKVLASCSDSALGSFGDYQCNSFSLGVNTMLMTHMFIKKESTMCFCNIGLKMDKNQMVEPSSRICHLVWYM